MTSSQFPRGRVGVSLSVTGYRRQLARVPESVGRSLREDCPPVSAPGATRHNLSTPRSTRASRTGLVIKNGNTSIQLEFNATHPDRARDFASQGLDLV
jgi:hypothetical protein